MPINFYSSSEGLGDLSRALISAPAIYGSARDKSRAMANTRMEDAAGIQKSLADARKTMMETRQLQDQQSASAQLPESIGTINAYQTGSQRRVAPPAVGSAGSALENSVNDMIRQNQGEFVSTAVPDQDALSAALANVIRAGGGNAEQMMGAMMQGGVGSEAVRTAYDSFQGPDLAAALQSMATGQNLPQMYDTNAQGTVLGRYSGELDESGRLAGANINAENALADQRRMNEGTSLMQHAQAAGLQPGTPEYQEFIREGANRSPITLNMGQDGVDYGDPEKGLVWARNPDGTVQLDERGAPIAVPYQGGSVYRDQREAETKRKAGAAVVTRAGQTVIRDVSTSIDTINKYGSLAAGYGSWLQWMPEGPAKELAADIASIQGNIAVDQLLKIKASGAGLGQVPQQQLEMLASLLGGLRQDMSPEKLKANLQDIRDIYTDIVEAEGGDPYAMAVARGWDPDNPDALLPDPGEQSAGAGSGGDQPATDRAPADGVEQIAAEARAAIEQGADPAAVRERLRQNGINPDELGL